MPLLFLFCFATWQPIFHGLQLLSVPFPFFPPYSICIVSIPFRISMWDCEEYVKVKNLETNTPFIPNTFNWKYVAKVFFKEQEGQALLDIINVWNMTNKIYVQRKRKGENEIFVHNFLLKTKYCKNKTNWSNSCRSQNE